MRQRTFDWNRDNRSSPHLSIIFFDTRIFLKHWRFTPRCFSILWDINFSTESCHAVFPLSLKFFDTTIFLKHRRVALRNFSVLWDKNFDKKKWYTHSSFIQKNFWYPKFSETKEGSPTKLFSTVRQRLWQKVVIHPPRLLSITFFDTRNFLKHRKVPLRHFSILWDKKFDRNTPRSSLIHKFFPYPKFSFLKARMVPLRKFSVLWDKNYEEKPWYTPFFSFP